MEKSKVIRHSFTGVFCLAGVVVFLGFQGGQWSDTFDGWGQGMRQSLGRPIAVKTVSTPLAPKGDWQLKITSRQWTWRNTDRTTEYQVLALNQGKPIIADANFDWSRAAHEFVKWPAEWQTDSALSFIDDTAGASRPTAALTVENATGEPMVPCLLIQDGAQAHYIFYLAAGAKVTLAQCLVPAQGESLKVYLGPQRQPLKMKAPAGTPKTLKIILKENQPEESVMEM